MTAVDRFSSDVFKRLLGGVNSVSFRDESGEVDYFGEKVVILRQDSFRLFRQELVRRNASGTGNLIMGIVGRSVGRAEGKTIVSLFKQETGSRSLGSEHIRSAVEETNLGYGKPVLGEVGTFTQAVTVSTKNSFEVGSQGSSEGVSCFFLLGYFEGLLSELLGAELRGVEGSCRNRGDALCEFRLTRNLETKFKI